MGNEAEAQAKECPGTFGNRHRSMSHVHWCKTSHASLSTIVAWAIKRRIYA